LESLKSVKKYPEFHLPLPNDYIPSDLSLLSGGGSQNPKYPEKVKCDEVLEVFYRQDTKFKLPMAHVLVSIVTNGIHESAGSVALADLYVLALKQILVEETYPASMVSLYYNVGISEHGLNFGVSGFNEKVHLLMDTILK
jgi:secreted Zn-dependent insulinase-like peptidase